LGNSQFSFLVFLVIVKKLECVFPRAYPFILGFENSKCYLNRLQSETIGVEHLFHNKTKNSFFWVPTSNKRVSRGIVTNLTTHIKGRPP